MGSGTPAYKILSIVHRSSQVAAQILEDMGFKPPPTGGGGGGGSGGSIGMEPPPNRPTKQEEPEPPMDPAGGPKTPTGPQTPKRKIVLKGRVGGGKPKTTTSTEPTQKGPEIQ